MEWVIGGVVLGMIGLMYREKQKKPQSRTDAVLLVSFGTMSSVARRSGIERLEKEVRVTFPNREIRSAFTSHMIRGWLAKEDIHIDDIARALERLAEEGYRRVVVQSVHITAGEEYENKVLPAAERYQTRFERLTVGQPLLTGDLTDAAEALRAQLPPLKEDEAVVFLGHGSPHRPNPAYAALQARLAETDDKVVVGVLEETDHPNFAEVLSHLQVLGAKTVILMPLLLTAGRHVRKDLAAWQARFEAEGYTVVPYMHGLGENRRVRQVYLARIRSAMRAMDE